MSFYLFDSTFNSFSHVILKILSLQMYQNENYFLCESGYIISIISAFFHI